MDYLTDYTTARAACEMNLQNLGKSDYAFAHGILETTAKMVKNGKVPTGKQIFWLKELSKKNSANPPDLPATIVGDMSKAVALFTGAAAHLKFPKVLLHDTTHGEIKLYRAGSKAKVPGSITVIENNTGKWLGRITVEGIFEHRNGTAQTLINLLVSFSEKPAEVAAAYGKLSGRCSFCHKHLDDEVSTALGYGPVCAKHWNLPHTVKAAKASGHMLASLAAMEAVSNV